ncbi:MAG: hypothetical protein IPN17_01260 [Deltaproteobacteria bacterium]|nr:hypothetical protein [Deltaproteobacteria bacterium]
MLRDTPPSVVAPKENFHVEAQDPAPKPNDQRSNIKNPNNPAFQQNRDNRANQLNPQHAPTKPAPDQGRSGQ